MDQLTTLGVIEASALYEFPFTDIDARGPEAVFSDKDEVIDGIFGVLEGEIMNTEKTPMTGVSNCKYVRICCYWGI
ncbi:hypothetical protein OAH23_10590 [Verrucomicrobia bacterium]|nr:hypothetical protein [Verrucomicrobiota bacterium]MDB4690855.1 hypothetical protein [Verrucomicrobiota bacterium]MDB4717745.1 hypothetical protein [Verrucomicrobiota bacterium]